MIVQFQLPDATANDLKELLTSSLTEKHDRMELLKSQLKKVENEYKNLSDLLTQLNSCEQKIQTFSEQNNTTLAHTLMYNEGWTWAKKIQCIMGYKNNIGLTTSQIANVLTELEPIYLIKKEKVKAIASISAILNSKTKEGMFHKKLNDKNVNLYFLSPF